MISAEILIDDAYPFCQTQRVAAGEHDGRISAMPKSMGVFLKSLAGRRRGTQAFSLLRSYDPSCSNKFVANRRYGYPPDVYCKKLLSRWESDADYHDDIGQLILDRTCNSDNSGGMTAFLELEASNAVLEYDEKQCIDGKTPGSIWDILAVGQIIQSEEFRAEFDDALKVDGFSRSTSGFWDCIMRVKQKIKDDGSDVSVLEDLILELQYEIVTCFMLASLLGPRSSFSIIARADKSVRTVAPNVAAESDPMVCVTPELDGDAQLQGIVFVGPNRNDWYTDPDFAEMGGRHAFRRTQVVRIGRDESWLHAEIGSCAIAVEDLAVSGWHCEIRYDPTGGSWRLYDVGTDFTYDDKDRQGSRNATLLVRANCDERLLLNGNEVSSSKSGYSDFDDRPDYVELRHGDIICLAPKRISQEDEVSQEEVSYTWKLGQRRRYFRFEVLNRQIRYCG